MVLGSLSHPVYLIPKAEVSRQRMRQSENLMLYMESKPSLEAALSSLLFKNELTARLTVKAAKEEFGLSYTKLNFYTLPQHVGSFY